MKKIYRAGVIPYYVEDGEIYMLFMLPSEKTYGGDCFQIAKGKREEGESDYQAAFREAGEELGLFKGNILNKHKLGNFLGRTMIYLAEIDDLDMFGDPHFETAKVKWMTPQKFDTIGRDLHKPIVKAAKRWITNNKNIKK